MFDGYLLKWISVPPVGVTSGTMLVSVISETKTVQVRTVRISNGTVNVKKHLNTMSQRNYMNGC